MPCSWRARGYGRSAEPVACACSSACPTPATLPCPKIPKQPGISRCRTPSRSLYWWARNRTTACATVNRTVPFMMRSLSVDLGLGDGRAGLQEVEVAALVGLGDVLQVQRPVAAAVL